MKLVFEDSKSRKIDGEEDVSFEVDAGVYIIEVSARAKSEKQLGLTDDEDLRLEIDRRKL